MKSLNIIEKLKSWISGIGFNLFIWGNNTTQEQYWEEIYQQEKAFKNSTHEQ